MKDEINCKNLINLLKDMESLECDLEYSDYYANLIDDIKETIGDKFIKELKFFLKKEKDIDLNIKLDFYDTYKYLINVNGYTLEVTSAIDTFINKGIYEAYLKIERDLFEIISKTEEEN